MKYKQGIRTFLIIFLVIAITASLSLENIITTSFGTADINIAVEMQVYKLLNPSSIKGMPVKEIRKTLNKDSTKWSANPIPFSNIKNMSIDTTLNKIPVRIYTPEGGGKFPIIVYSHGGFWMAGNVDSYENVCRKLAKNTKAIVISVEYRLAPENPFPAGLDDVYNVVQWAHKNADSINGDAKHIAVVGDSAGGNLSAVVSQMARDKNGPHLTCQVLIYPSTNIYELNTKSWSYMSNILTISKEDMEDFTALYVPKKEDRKNPYVSPLLAKDLKNLPPTLMITAEIDPLRDEGKAYAEKLKEAGNQVVVTMYKGCPHGFITMDKITSEADKALNEISSYLQNEFHKDTL